jgi:hypothetical protein
MGCGPHKGWLVYGSSVDSIMADGQSFTGARPSGCSRSQLPAVVGGKWTGQRGTAGELLTGAWMVARRQRTGGGASAPNDDGASAIGGRWSRTRGVESFTKVGSAFL